MQRLLDVEKTGVIQPAKRVLVAGPLVRAVCIDGPWQGRPRPPLARGRHGGRVPAGRDFDLDAPVPALRRFVNPTREHVGSALWRNAERDAAGNGAGRLDVERFTEQRREPGIAALCYEVPDRSLDPGAREPITTHTVAQHGVQRGRRGSLELPAHTVRPRAAPATAPRDRQ